METNLTFKQQLILATTRQLMNYHSVENITDEMVERIREIADKLSEGLEESGSRPIGISLDAKLKDYGIRHRSLEYNNIETVGDLVQRTPFELLKFRNFGKGSLLEVENFLDRYGLKLCGR